MYFVEWLMPVWTNSTVHTFRKCGGAVVGHLVSRDRQKPLRLPQSLLCFRWCMRCLSSCKEEEKKKNVSTSCQGCLQGKAQKRSARLFFVSCFVDKNCRRSAAAVKRENLCSTPLYRLCFGATYPEKMISFFRHWNKPWHCAFF